MQSVFVGIVVALMTLTSFCLAFADEAEGESRKIEFSGTLEGEFGYIAAEEEDESDFALATVELGADVSLMSDVNGHILFLYEQGENDDNIALDEGALDLKFSVSLPVELSLSLGRMYVPFGQFNSHFVADPFTLKIGETSQVALQILASHEMVEGSVALYNEDIDVEDTRNTQIGDIAARLAVSAPEGALGRDVNLSLGTSFITNVAGTDGLTDMTGICEICERTMGLGSFVSVSAMGAFLEGEVIMVLGDIEMSNGEKFKPRAFNVESGYSLPGLPVEIAGKYEQLSENSDNTINRFGVVVSLGLFDEAVPLVLEFHRTDDGTTAVNSIVSQLAIGF